MKYVPFVIGVAEVVAFVAVASAIGAFWTIMLALLTTLIGILAFRRAGLRAWATLREAAATGQVVDEPEMRKRLAGTGSRMLGMLLLMLPGFITDVAGALLLVPAVRRKVGQRVGVAAMQRFPFQPSSGPMGRNPPGDGRGNAGGTVIEGELIDGPEGDPDGT